MKSTLNIESYSPLPPFAAYAGSKSPKILFIAEAWGEDEERLKQPLVGYSGKEFHRMLFEVFPEVEPELITKILSLMGGDAWIYWRDKWLEIAKIGFTNTLAFRPLSNNLKNICIEKKLLPKDYSLSAMIRGAYLEPKYLPELQRLKEEIISTNPNIIVTLGNSALWALKGELGISKLRGTITQSSLLVPNRKMLATYHPQAAMYSYYLRPILVADLHKSKFESRNGEIKRPQRFIVTNPNLRDIEEWFLRPSQYHAVDIETKNRQIEMIGFARKRDDAIVIPFIDFRAPNRSYWRDLMEEVAAWELIERYSLNNPNIKKVFQNGLFDLQYILPMGIRVINASEDTMLLHHSIHPEMPKGLGFMGSIYSNEPAWKLMRLKGETEENKRDE